MCTLTYAWWLLHVHIALWLHYVPLLKNAIFGNSIIWFCVIISFVNPLLISGFMNDKLWLIAEDWRKHCPHHSINILSEKTSLDWQGHVDVGVVYIDEPAEWTTRELRQMQTADPVGMGRKSRQYTLYSSKGYRHDILSIYRLDQLCLHIWLNSFVFNFAGSSRYNSFIHGQGIQTTTIGAS